VWECFKENDTEGALDAIRTFIEARNKLCISQTKNISRSTIYNALKPGANPTLKTFSKLIHASLSDKQRTK
jgi:DNA-binding phage protein